MRKIISMLVALCVMLLPMAAMAQSAGNLNNDGFVETDGTSLFVAKDDGLWRVDDGAAAKISDDRASGLQWYEGRLYYLADEYDTDEYGDTQMVSQTPKSCLADGSDLKTLSDAREVGEKYDYPEEEGGVTLRDSYVGYRCFTVYGGAIYFLGNDGEAGEYTCEAQQEDGNTTGKGRYESGIALYRMNLDGSGETKLTQTLGNSVAQMAVADDKIYLATGYADVIYAYNFVNYAICDLSGNVLTAFENTAAQSGDDWGFHSDVGAFYHIPDAVLPDGDDMIVSLCDSEGDFVSSKLVCLQKDGSTEQLAIQMNYVHGVIEDGTLYYMASASNDIFYDEDFDYDASLGVYARDLAAEGTGDKLLGLSFNGFTYGLKLGVVGEYVYILGSDGSVYRVPKQGDTIEKLMDAGFEAVSQIEYTEAD